jgi:hypothetical protein
MVGGRAREPCKAMGRDGREMERDCKDPYRTTSQMVVVVRREIDIRLGF